MRDLNSPPSSIFRDMIRRAAAQMREDAMSLPAPCGCAPRVRCDRHCRVKIRRVRDLRGQQRWAIECNGVGEVDDYFEHGPYFGMAPLHATLPDLHQEAAKHVARHRIRAAVGQAEGSG